MDGSTDTIELADSGWHLLHVADLNCLVGAGLTHSFTSDGFYYGTAETPAITYTDPGEEGVCCGTDQARGLVERGRYGKAPKVPRG
jgi:hypothetical protein